MEDITPLSNNNQEKEGAQLVEDVKANETVDPENLGAINATSETAKHMLEAAGNIAYTPEDSRRVVRMIDWRVLLSMCLMYVSQQLDKSALGWAGTFNIQEDTGLVGTQYSWLTTCVYLAELIFQPLSMYALSYFPVRYWLLFNYVGWSTVSICTAACTNFTSLMVVRTLLGIFEASIQPANFFMTQMWYTRREQARRTIAWEIANSGAGFVGPLIAYGVGHATTRIKAYQGIYLCVGGLSFFFMPLVVYLLPSSPTEAKFLSKGNDRLIALDRMKENNMGTKSGKWNWKQCWETFCDPKTYIWFLMFVCVAAPSGGFGAFGGLVTKGFGFSSFTAILTGLPSPVINSLAMLFAGYMNDKFRKRFIVIAFLCLFPIAGQASLLSIPRSKPGALLGVTYIGAVSGALQPLLWAWANLNASGTTKRVLTTSIMFTGSCVGNMIGPQLFISKEAPLYYTGLRSCLSLFTALCALIVVQGLYLMYLNKKQEKRRIDLGLPAAIRDISLMAIEEAEAYKAELTAMLRTQNMTEGQLFSHAYDDMTDWENPMFMYAT
ncbi:putative allantoate transporter [Naematelia encephala]|uniref:Putative allantoate transporter n=1 Tax=Naematelia encephala TaxID=71784 RepID=A0A1Y2AQJ0_9TREE|nr:putative allantoate transporter [Naematelia encephala]